MHFINETEMYLEKVCSNSQAQQEEFVASIKPQLLRMLATESQEDHDPEGMTQTAEETSSAKTYPEKVGDSGKNITDDQEPKQVYDEMYQVLLCIGDSRGQIHMMHLNLK